MKLRTLFLCLILTFSSTILAQITEDTTATTKVQLVKVTKNDKSVYIGEILKDDGREILIKTKTIGNIYINKSEIKSIQPIEELEETFSGNYREEGPFKTRYYFTNNALIGKKGDHYALVHLHGPEIHFAVSNRLSIGVMAMWFASPIGLALKYVIPTQNEKLNFSLGTIMLSSGYLFQSRGWGGLHWGTATYGKSGRNISLSSGIGYINLGLGNFTGKPDFLKAASVSSIAGIFPVGDKASFIFDSMITLSERRNYLTNNFSFMNSEGDLVGAPSVYKSGTEVSSFFMPGMRFQNSERRAFQVALAGIIQYSSIGFSYSETASRTRSFPFPMCSWFFKL